MKIKEILKETTRDPALFKAKEYAKVHYPLYRGDEDEAFDKWVQRGLSHSEENDFEHEDQIEKLEKKVNSLDKRVDQLENQPTTEGLKDPQDNPCWKGYKPVGTKKKGGRTVPNCVPKSKK